MLKTFPLLPDILRLKEWYNIYTNNSNNFYMINISQVISMLQINGLDKSASKEDVEALLQQLSYSEEDKQEAFNLLSAQGWFLGEVQSQSVAYTPPVPSLLRPLQSSQSIPSSPPATLTMPMAPVGNIGLAQIQPIGLSNKSPKKIVISSIIILIFVLLGGGLTYAYIQKIGPFFTAIYTEDKFFSILLDKFNQINSSSYTVSVALDVVPRDKDATPFVVKTSNTVELKQQYFYDSQRMKNVLAIISALNRSSNYFSYAKASAVKPYPANIKTLFTANPGIISNNSIIDPVTNKEYEYQVIDNGKNFLLTVDFGTNDAIKAIKKYDYKSTTTIITGKKVSFTKDSSLYTRMSAEPPKPFFVQMSESMAMLPPDINAKGAFSVSAEVKPTGMTDWLFNIDAGGSFGDLTYKINADALKKADNYYFKINNVPSFFLFGDLVTVKGKWVSISS